MLSEARTTQSIEVELEQLMERSRQEQKFKFPKKEVEDFLFTRKEILLAGAVAASSLIFGCPSSEKRESPRESADGLSADDIINNLNEYYSRIQQESNPHGYFQFLRVKDKECIVPDNIFMAYAHVMHKEEIKWYVPVGTFINYNHLQDQEKLHDFRERLTFLSILSEKRQFYERLFSTTGTIIFRESLLAEKKFEVALPHERVHKLLWLLPQKQYNRMQWAANGILAKKMKDGSGFVLQKEDPNSKKYIEEAVRSWEEFYTYLAEGEFDDRVEEELKKYRDVYQIFLIIKKQSKFDKHISPVQ
jgi:hypothetical protein